MRNLKSKAIIIGIILSLTLLSVISLGCTDDNGESDRDKFIGTWGTVSVNSLQYFKFDEDGSGIQRDCYPYGYGSSNDPCFLESPFKWKIKDGNLVMDGRDISYHFKDRNTVDIHWTESLTHTWSRESGFPSKYDELCNCNPW